ncbi:MAG: hypothetical protein ACHREM_12005 [Polyangiales bacterium]
MSVGCKDKVKYKPEPAYSGEEANLPAVPKIAVASTFKSGADWTIYGVQHQLNNPRHKSEVEQKDLSITGFVVKVYRPEEPKGKEGCVYAQKKHPPTSKEPYPPNMDCTKLVPQPEPPHFWIADKKDEPNPAKWVMVEGYASTFIQQAMARDWYSKGGHKIDSTKADDLYLDNNYSSQITILGEPKIGSKVVVSGKFGSFYQEGMGGKAVSPYGIIDVTSTKKGKIDLKDGDWEIMELK